MLDDINAALGTNTDNGLAAVTAKRKVSVGSLNQITGNIMKNREGMRV